jgi:hypothetical protein
MNGLRCLGMDDGAAYQERISTRPCSLARRTNVSAGDPESALLAMVSLLALVAGACALLFYMMIAH